MFRKLIAPIALVAGLALGPAYAADQQAAAQQRSSVAQICQAREPQLRHEPGRKRARSDETDGVLGKAEGVTNFREQRK